MTTIRRGLLALCTATLMACGGGDDGGRSNGGDDDDGDGGSASSTTDATTGVGGSTGAQTGGGGTATGPASTGAGARGPVLDPPAGASSNGSGGQIVSGATQQANGITYRLIVPESYAGAATPLLIVYSGVEGGQNMTNNLTQLGSYTSTDGFIRAVLDGKTYNGNGDAGATVLDDVRAKYNVDNDRTYLLGESAGTSAAHELGFDLRPSYFGAYWANDVNAAGSPSKTSADLGFQPWGQVGPGGAFAIADQIVSGMEAASYRLPNPAPYAGAGAAEHGNVDQFIAALKWFDGKTRQ